MTDSHAEASDLDKAINGDRDAAARLLMQHGDRLARRVTRRLELNPFADFSVEDVLQEAYVDTFVGFATFDPEKGTSFAAWLDRVVENRLVTMLRERQRKKRKPTGRRVANDLWRSSAAELGALLSDYRGQTPSDDYSRGEVVEAIRDQTAALPSDQREAIELHYLEGRSLNSTADVLGKTKDAVRGLIHRAKQSLRAALGNSSRWFRRK